MKYCCFLYIWLRLAFICLRLYDVAVICLVMHPLFKCYRW